MSNARRWLMLLFLLLALVAAIASLSLVPGFFQSSKDYGEHHEATLPLCRFLSLVALSLGLALAAGRLPQNENWRASLNPLGAMLVVSLAAFVASLIFTNEIFYSLFDPKGFPVHPTKQVVFPEAGWHGLPDHLIAAILIFFSFGFLWLTLRKKRKTGYG